MLSLQERYAPHNRCFGCGPENRRGLRIRSFRKGEDVVARFRPQPHHAAFDQVMNGGICATLLDCNSNWAAAYHLMVRDELDELPSTVTADLQVTLDRPTPTDTDVVVRSRVSSSDGPRVVVEGVLEADGIVTARVRATFVAVAQGHPAYHRWQ